MKKFIETIKNIFKIEELRTRLGYTFLLVLVYRLGCFIVLPGIDTTLLASLQDSTQQGLVGLLNMFSGGAFGNASIFALGVMPYISASIVIQLLGISGWTRSATISLFTSLPLHQMRLQSRSIYTR